MAVTLFGLTGVTAAVQPAKVNKPVPVAQQFVNITTSPDRLNLGTTTFPGIHDLPEALTVEVESNCLHGSIVISSTKLTRRGGGVIMPERISVQSPATVGYVKMSKPVAISKPTEGSHKIVLDFRVQSDMIDLAGKYTGTFTFTIMPPV